jgi:hypothetical protein
MADALEQTEAPLKKKGTRKKREEIVIEKEVPKEKEKLTKEDIALAQQFDTEKKYMFQLAEETPVRELPVINVREKRAEPHKKFKPWQNIVLTSQIVWNGQRRTIRFYDGCTTLFVDEQPKEKDIIEGYIKQTKQRVFLEGKFGCFGDERMLLLYLFICSWNTDSEFRTRTASPIFKATNADKIATEESRRMDAIEEAMRLAREASSTKMKIHANFLGIPETDYDSGNELTEKEIRTAYRQRAADSPTEFIESYGNKSIEIKYFIDKALEKGLISNTFNANRATWKGSNTEICDISGLKSHVAISERLFEFSQLDAGEEFKIQLKALFN